MTFPGEIQALEGGNGRCETLMHWAELSGSINRLLHTLASLPMPDGLVVLGSPFR